jgi:cellobiose-specific phosphotransferase system component IIA
MNIKYENHGDQTRYNFLCVHFQEKLSTAAQKTVMFLTIPAPYIRTKMNRTRMKTQWKSEA